MRKIQSFAVQDPELFLQKAARWAGSFPLATIFHSCAINFPYGAFPNMICTGREPIHETVSFSALDQSFSAKNDWHIGYFGYDLKNQIENLSSKNESKIPFNDCSFYIPENLIHFDYHKVTIESFTYPDKIYDEISSFPLIDPVKNQIGRLKINISKSEYIDIVNALKEHIINGDIYEINFCIEPFFEAFSIDTVDTYFRLMAQAPAPFSCLHKVNDQWLLCASPERFLKKEQEKLISQPIKGTSRRGQDSWEDNKLKTRLAASEKERAENLMIVDLVRNDLAKSSRTGTVQVEELFGIYSFRHWHQMISTVTSSINPGLSFVQAIYIAFPMGSMTGAPKIKAMELIDHYESFRRGLYSGAMGYITPSGDFDFNVVIRSILYDSSLKTATLPVGSAITYDADPEYEFRECILKAKGIIQTLFDSEPIIA